MCICYVYIDTCETPAHTGAVYYCPDGGGGGRPGTTDLRSAERYIRRHTYIDRVTYDRPAIPVKCQSPGPPAAG